MKPKTKKQHMIVELAGQLPALTERQREYPKEHIFKPVGYYWKNGQVWCQHCGHMYHQTHGSLAISLEIESETCPRCGCHLKLKHYREASGKECDERVNYTVITTFKGYQVFRTFEAMRYNRQGSDTIYATREVYQNWLDEHFNEVIVSRSYNRSPFYFRWNHYSDFGIQRHNDSATGSYAMPDVFNITDNWFYPRANVLPALKRNGWQNCFLKMGGVNVIDLMNALLENSDVEMLAKTGQHDILQYWMRRGFYLSQDRENDFFHAIKIANRNGYKVKDAAMWYDLLDALSFLNLDTHNAHYVCPADLKAAHDLYVARMKRVKERQERERKIAEAKSHEAAYKKAKGRYFGICFGNEHIVITVIQSVAEMAEEGAHMHHCVYEMGYYQKRDSLILSARNRGDGQRVETVELNLKTFAVMQSRGVQNSVTPYHNEIVGLVNQNIGLFKQAKSNKIKAAI
ncbi:MAG: PcfJ domain-containing protein [Prevotella sp.]|nr:PcfJ domain-containing protein [Prevotella sp.]